MFLGWYDPDKKKPARRKVEEAMERYVEKFGSDPETCLASATDAAELIDDKKAPDIPVRSVNYLPRFTFYVGVEEEPQDDLLAA
jgi:hypothetical protein